MDKLEKPEAVPVFMQKMVTEFHAAFEILINSTPTPLDAETIQLRKNLIDEELGELKDAMDAGDILGVADGLADLLYVVVGTAVSYGIDMAPIFTEVHRSNMSKVGGEKRLDGKWLKPDSYSPANLWPLLHAQGSTQFDCRCIECLADMERAGVSTE